MSHLGQILSRLPGEVRQPIEGLPDEIKNSMEEIRIQLNRSIRITAGNREIVLATQVSDNLFDTILNNLLDYSIYAYEDEIAKGFITIEGGHRVGLCGRAVLENNHVRLLKDISSLNIRRSHQIPGCADKVYDQIVEPKFGVHNTVIVSPPRCGKTTILRDMVRLLSNRGFRVGVCDERSEIAGMYQGNPSYDLGPRTDVLDSCPKAEGMRMLIRSMAPDVLVTDEIGRPEDMDALETGLCAGVKIITTIHGSDFRDLKQSNLYPLIEKKAIERIIYLSNVPATGTIREVQHV